MITCGVVSQQFTKDPGKGAIFEQYLNNVDSNTKAKNVGSLNKKITSLVCAIDVLQYTAVR